MLTTAVMVTLGVVALYSVIGLVFGVFFITGGVARIDPVAKDGSWGFRLLILPGSVALWPLLVRRLLAKTSPPVENNAHRSASMVRP